MAASEIMLEAVGRGIVALATDSDRGRWSQQSVDSQPPRFRFPDVDVPTRCVWRHVEQITEAGLVAES